jgi:NTE family protein
MEMQVNPHEENAVARPKIAVVIGGIGVRAVAAIPLFEFLDEVGIKADLLIGSSGGALMVAMRGAGYRTAEMRKLVDDMNFWMRRRSGLTC